MAKKSDSFYFGNFYACADCAYQAAHLLERVMRDFDPLLIREKLDAGIDVLLDIEVQGAAKVRARCPDALFIFIIPPSFEELSRRLHGRNTDSEDVIAGRLEKAKIEFREIPTYDYLVINDKVSNAVEEIEAILVANECRVDNRRNILKGEFSL